MIKGVSRADATLLIVSAVQKEFEWGLKFTTNEHALIAYHMGVR